MAIKAVLFDVGGPIDTETARERAFDEAIVAALAEEGISVTPAVYATANAQAVADFAPSAYKAIIWSLSDGNVEHARAAYARFIAAAEYLPDIEPRPGIAELLASLRGRGMRLGLAANQQHDVLKRLDAHGLGGFFEHREVSGTHGYRKPDVRLFLRCCDALAVAQHECIMVGDRIDNDIAPARSLGMHAILFRTGRHIAQEPRSWDEVPCAEVTSVPELGVALDSLIGGTP